MENGDNLNVGNRIALYLSQFNRGKILDREDWEELESHLHDHVDDLIKEGMNAEKALEISFAQMGEPDAVSDEYYKKNSKLYQWSQPLVGLVFSKKTAAFCMLFIGIAFGSLFAERNRTPPKKMAKKIHCSSELKVDFKKCN